MEIIKRNENRSNSTISISKEELLQLFKKENIIDPEIDNQQHFDINFDYDNSLKKFFIYIEEIKESENSVEYSLDQINFLKRSIHDAVHHEAKISRVLYDALLKNKLTTFEMCISLTRSELMMRKHFTEKILDELIEFFISYGISLKNE